VAIGSILLVCAGLAAQQPRPNILLVIVDDNSYEHFSYFGHAVLDTPNFDSILSTGSVFLHGVNTMSVCRPRWRRS
jgi:arylsulfatase A-like enzyme